MEFDDGEFIYNNFSSELIFRHVSNPEIIKLDDGGYAVTAIVEKNGTSHIRVDVYDENGALQRAPIYLEQPPGVYSMFPSIVEIEEHDEIVNVDGNDQTVTIPKGLLVLYNQGAEPDDMAQYATFLGQINNNWEGNLVTFTNRTTDAGEIVNKRALYSGDRERTRRTRDGRGAIRATYDRHENSILETVGMRVRAFNSTIHLPLIFRNAGPGTNEQDVLEDEIVDDTDETSIDEGSAPTQEPPASESETGDNEGDDGQPGETDDGELPDNEPDADHEEQETDDGLPPEQNEQETQQPTIEWFADIGDQLQVNAEGNIEFDLSDDLPEGYNVEVYEVQELGSEPPKDSEGRPITEPLVFIADGKYWQAWHYNGARLNPVEQGLTTDESGKLVIAGLNKDKRYLLGVTRVLKAADGSNLTHEQVRFAQRDSKGNLKDGVAEGWDVKEVVDAVLVNVQ